MHTKLFVHAIKIIDTEAVYLIYQSSSIMKYIS